MLFFLFFSLFRSNKTLFNHFVSITLNCLKLWVWQMRPIYIDEDEDMDDDDFDEEAWDEEGGEEDEEF